MKRGMSKLLTAVTVSGDRETIHPWSAVHAFGGPADPRLVRIPPGRDRGGNERDHRPVLLRVLDPEHRREDEEENRPTEGGEEQIAKLVRAVEQARLFLAGISVTQKLHLTS